MADGETPKDEITKVETALLRLTHIEKLHEGLAKKVSHLEGDLKTAATLEQAASIRDHVRDYADKKDQDQADATEKSINMKIGGLRAGIMSDTEKLMKENLREWIKPLFEEFAAAREEARKVERDLEVQRWRNRGALAVTGAVLFIYIFQLFVDGRAMTRGEHVDALRDVQRTIQP
ncbi:MAG: hypothetical protein AAGF20_00045 [Pseudomonadota bacterium]